MATAGSSAACGGGGSGGMLDDRPYAQQIRGRWHGMTKFSGRWMQIARSMGRMLLKPEGFVSEISHHTEQKASRLSPLTSDSDTRRLRLLAPQGLASCGDRTNPRPNSLFRPPRCQPGAEISRRTNSELNSDMPPMPPT